MTSIRKIQKQNACLHDLHAKKKRVFHCNNCNALYVNVHFTAYQWHSKGVVRPGRHFQGGGGKIEVIPKNLVAGKVLGFVIYWNTV